MTRSGNRRVPAPVKRNPEVEKKRLARWAETFRKQKAPHPDWYTLGELADYLNIQKDTARKWVQEGRLPQAKAKTHTGWPVWSPQQVKQILREINYGPTEEKHGLG